MSIGDGANYAPEGQASRVVADGEFNFAAAHLDHGHIYGMVGGLIQAGGTLTAVYDTDEKRLEQFLGKFPNTPVVNSLGEILNDQSIHLVASAAIPDQRSSIGCQVMSAGKDFFTDKSPFTSLEQLAEAKSLTTSTGQKYLVYYAERLHNDAAWHAGQIIGDGAIGQVLQVLNIAPHRLAAPTRPDWFFQKAHYGGILTDIGSHQVEQFLTYAACNDGEVTHASVRTHSEHPELEVFGEMSLTGNNGASFYSRVDWFTPEGLPVWGDGRTFILGTKGSMELRKYIDPNRAAPASMIVLTDGQRVEEIDCLGKTGFPYFGQLILDVLNRTENCMTQEHCFKAAELSMLAQQYADAAQKSPPIDPISESNLSI